MGMMFLIYFASIVENVQGLLFVITLFFASITVYMIVGIDIDKENGLTLGNTVSVKTLKRFAVLTMIFGLITALIPKERHIYYMAAAYMGTSVVNSITESPELKKVRLIINNEMDEYIKEKGLKDPEAAK